MNFGSIHDAKAFLQRIPAFSDEGSPAADFSLDRFKKFCESIGNPQNDFRAVHVAGSNGKGSTCAFIESIYRQAGYKTGLYTSPHLIDVRERFKMNGKQIAKEEFITFFQKYTSLIASFRLTYFEITTALAFWWFARKNIDIGIIETGLGGRLDATNIINPLVSVITSISLDHTDILGDTIKEITREKAGIIKPGVPVVTGKVPASAEQQIKKIAEEKKSMIRDVKSLDPHVESGTFYINIVNNRTALKVPFTAPVQAYNAAMAWQTCELLQEKMPVSESHIKRGIQKADNCGRFQRLHFSREWYFDGAHNAEAIQAMKEAVNTIGDAGEAILVLSLMKDKVNKKMIKELLEFKKIFYYTNSTTRGAGFEYISERLSDVNPFPAAQECRHNLLDELKNELVIFGGSFYFYPTVKKWISSYCESRSLSA